MVLTGHSLGRNKLDQLLAQGRMTREQIEEQYSIARRIQAEEFCLDASELVVTSTRQEVEDQWGLYDGFDVRLERVLRARQLKGVSCHGRFMPRMAVSGGSMLCRCVDDVGRRKVALWHLHPAAMLLCHHHCLDGGLERVLRVRQVKGVSCHGRFMPRMTVSDAWFLHGSRDRPTLVAVCTDGWMPDQADDADGNVELE